jgi:NAD(P)-dependent dehydrogenase (short-subunit alcohol dehydrogenase family)
MNRVWLITGASSGFGRSIAEAALAAGDDVVASARRPSALADLVSDHPGRVLALELDVTDAERIPAAVAEAVAWRGRLDVLVNNAGYALVGAVEENTDAELRGMLEVMFFGAAAMTRAVLPHLRGRGSGAIVQISSLGGQLSFAGYSAYSAAKFALEGLSEALADEVNPLGIKVLIVEPGSFRTGLQNGFAVSTPIPAYQDTVGATARAAAASDGTQAGDPAKAAAAIIAALDAEHTPLRLPLGSDAVDLLLAHSDRFRRELATWEEVSRGTDFD